LPVVEVVYKVGAYGNITLKIVLFFFIEYFIPLKSHYSVLQFDKEFEFWGFLNQPHVLRWPYNPFLFIDLPFIQSGVII
jgi:hypothetical protein